MAFSKLSYQKFQNDGSIKYTPEVDGLRAFAILIVIAYHLNRNVISYGYLGVDIFFTISGFLITSILLKNQISFNTLTKFFIRRIRRILPALFVMLFISFFLAWDIYLDAELFTDYSKQLLASLAGLSNFYFWRTSDYFSQDLDDLPLIHL